MDLASILNMAISFLSGFGPTAKAAALILSLLAGIPSLITAVIVLWHGVVGLIKALSLLFPGLKNLATKLSASQASLDSESNVLLNWLNRLSAIKPPAA